MIFRGLIGSSCGLLAVVLSAAGIVQAQSKEPAIIPAPLSSVSTNSTLKVSDGAVIAYPEGDSDAAFAAEYLARIVQRTRGIKLVVRPARTGSLKSALIVFRKDTPTESAKKDSYDLSVSGKDIEITAADRGGLFYGAVTLWGMLTADGAHRGAAELTGEEIHDAPEFQWRGLMLDSARHMQSIEFIRQLIDWMALHKLNTLHWHLTDDQGWRLEIKRYPKLTEVGAWRVLPSMAGKIDPGTKKPYRYGGYYTQEQVRALVAYAAQRNITIVPEIEMPGHATAALASYPEFASTNEPPTTPALGYGIYPNLYNPTQATFTFIENILTEVMQLFPSTYIHVGGDEAIKNQWKASPQIQAQMKALGVKDEDQLQSYFIKQIDTFLTAHGRRTLGWDEILQGGLAPGATVMSWRGMQGGISAAKQGHDVVLTPTRPLYFNYRQSDAADEAPGRFALNTLSDVYHFNTSPPALTEEEKSHILGVQGSMWTEYFITNDRLEWTLFPRVAALAELGWLPPEKRNWDDFLDRLVVQERRYGVLGIHHAPSAFRVRSSTQLKPGQNKVSVELHNQTNFGTIRYTVNGSAVTAASPAYEKPFDLPLPSHLRAAAFRDGEIPESGIDQKLNALSVRRRFSQELKLCVNDPSIQMEPDPPVPGRPVMLANYKKPCWLYNDADLTGIRSVAAEVTSIPYVFHDVSGTTAAVSPTQTPDGELNVYLDSCTGTVLATLPLKPAVSNRNMTLLRALLPATSGTHSLCFKFANPNPNKLWMIYSVQLETGKDISQ